MSLKKIVLLILFLVSMPCFSAEQTQKQTSTPITAPQNIAFENCTKIFNIKKDDLFDLTLASLSANKFLINEIQTSNGYVIFTANRNKYLATVAGIDSANSILKITPCNNIYNFPLGIITNVFKYIEVNK